MPLELIAQLSILLRVTGMSGSEHVSGFKELDAWIWLRSAPTPTRASAGLYRNVISNGPEISRTLLGQIFFLFVPDPFAEQHDDDRRNQSGPPSGDAQAPQNRGTEPGDQRQETRRPDR